MANEAVAAVGVDDHNDKDKDNKLLVKALESVAINSSNSDDNKNNSDNDSTGSSSSSSSTTTSSRRILLLDAGYGFPREKKVRKEKINAIASQLSNFLVWQTTATATSATECQQQEDYYALVRVVGCPDDNTKTLLENRTIDNMNKNYTKQKQRAAAVAGNADANADATATPRPPGSVPAVSLTSLPPHVTITCESLEECLQLYALDGTNATGVAAATAIPTTTTPDCCYLSPDAEQSLNPAEAPPRIAIVGLLIDRRVQPNRSRDRAANLATNTNITIAARRWPLEECFDEIDPCEPLNVDCVLEGMQQWWWNRANYTRNVVHGSSSKESKSNDTTSMLLDNKETFVQAVAQAIEHHAQRHPSRPLHIVNRSDASSD